jgi:hypothetical protein
MNFHAAFIAVPGFEYDSEASKARRSFLACVVRQNGHAHQPAMNLI